MPKLNLALPVSFVAIGRASAYIHEIGASIIEISVIAHLEFTRSVLPGDIPYTERAHVAISDAPCCRDGFWGLYRIVERSSF